MRAFVEGVGLAGPGLRGWDASRAALAGSGEYRHASTAVEASALLPAAERRRIGMPVKLALATGCEAFGQAGREAAATATVFASSSGDCDNLHYLLETLASPEREVSPTRFHNSVHNVAAGYWSIATGSRAASTTVCCHDASLAAGLLEAMLQSGVNGYAVALIAYDHPYPAPIGTVRPITASFGVAVIVASQPTPRSMAALDVAFLPQPAEATRMTDTGLEALRAGVPAARCLPLLAAIARGSRETLSLEYVAGTHLRVTVAPCS